MPNVTATPVSQTNGDIITEFKDTASTTAATYTYPTKQDYIWLKNNGSASITLMVGSLTQVVSAGTSYETDVEYNSISIQSSADTQECYVRAIKRTSEAGQSTVYVSRYSTPQLAIAAAATGDTVVFDGMYEIATPLVITKKINLAGLGSGTGIRMTSTTQTGIEVNLASAGPTLDFISITKMDIIGPGSGTGTGIKTKNLNFFRVKECNIKNWGLDGLYLINAAENTQISGNQFLDNLNAGCKIADSVHDFLFTNNHVEGNRYGIHASTVSLSVNIQVVGNNFDDQTSHGIKIDGFVLDVNITGNIFENSNGTALIEIDTSTAEAQGYHFDGVISGNTFRDTSIKAILCNGVDGLSITGNSFIGVLAHPCIEWTSISGATTAINAIVGNIFNSLPTASSPVGGIYFRSVAVNHYGVSISNNVMHRIKGYGIKYEGQYATIVGNVMSRVDGDGLGQSAIELSTVGGTEGRCTVMGNAIRHAGTTMPYGINEINGDNSVIMGNTITGYLTGAVNKTGTNTINVNNVA